MAEEPEEVYKRMVEKGTEEVQIEIPKEVRETLETIAQIIGGDFRMEVRIGKPGGGSFFNPEDCSITFDPLDIRGNFRRAKFVAAHEGAHRAISLGPRELGLPEKQIRKLYSQIGFAYLQNIIEDPAVNDWMRQRYPGLEEYVRETYDEEFKEENAIASTPETQRIALRLGYWPRFVQYGSEVIRYWHQGRFSTRLDPAVERALKRTIGYARESISTIPDPLKPSRDKKEIIEAAQKRFKINTEWIWPEVKKLVEMDLHTEEQRQMLQEFRKKQKELEQRRRELEEARRKGNKQREEELEEEIERLERELAPFDELPEDAKKELQEKVDEAIKEAEEKLRREIEEKQKQIDKAKQKQKQLEEEIKELEEKLKSATGEEKEELERQLQEKKAEKLSEEIKQSQREKELKEIQDGLRDIQSGEQMPYPESELSDKTKKALEELFQKLPKQKQDELKEKARRQLEDFEDAVNKEMQGKLNKYRPESHKERRERERKEREIEEIKRRQEEERRRQEEERERIRRQLEQMHQEGMSEYDKVYKEVADIIDSLYNRLKKFFLQKRHPKWRKGPTGERVNLNRAMQAEADPRYLSEILEKKTIPQKFNYRFSILVDLSGSMAGEKIEETFKGVVVLAEVLEKLGIQYEILGFQDTIIPYKEFREKLNKQVRDRLAIAKKEPTNKGVHNQARWNSDGYALYQAYERLKNNRGKDNFLIVLSDGRPEPDPEHAGEEWDLKRIVERILADKQVKLIGIGLGPGTEHVKEYYPHGFANLKMRVSEEERRQGQKDFAEALADLLEDMIRNPKKY